MNIDRHRYGKCIQHIQCIPRVCDVHVEGSAKNRKINVWIIYWWQAATNK